MAIPSPRPASTFGPKRLEATPSSDVTSRMPLEIKAANSRARDVQLPPVGGSDRSRHKFKLEFGGGAFCG